MKKYILLLFVIGFGLNACKNANEKELGQLEGLISIVNDTEKVLFSVDTSRVYAAKRQMQSDLAELESTKDTLTREEAFKLDDYYANKKQIFRLTDNYTQYINQLNFSKKQLSDLKTDVENNVISKNDFPSYYTTEQNAVIGFNSQINNAVTGLEEALQKLQLNRPEILEMIAQKKLKVANKQK